ncbi:magnesium transporter [Candidatus Pacearchaeota archaeon]|nr:magnesium transporter [Candidatus Pacearchaeota archaeon]
MPNEYNAGNIVKTALPLLTFATLFGIASGVVLDTYEDFLLIYPGTLILVPVMIGLGGNLGSILGARLTSALHLGIVELRITDHLLRNNFLAILIVGVISFFAVGVFGQLFCVLFGFKSPGLVKMVLISSLSGILLTLIIALTAILSAFISYGYGLDPDDTTIPIVTSISDVFGILALFGVMMVVL